MKEQVVEILAPAGNKDALLAAVRAGADAVYVGGSRFGARAYAANFTEEELLFALDYVHMKERKLYLTVNTLVKQSEIDSVYDFLLPFYRQGLDGVIVQDFGVGTVIRQAFPDLELHASTQMAVTGADGAAFLQGNGYVRVVPCAGDFASGDSEDQRKNGPFCGVFRSRGPLLLLFRTVSFKQHDRRQERKPGAVRPALPSSLQRKRGQTLRSYESEGSVYHRSFAGAS